MAKFTPQDVVEAYKSKGLKAEVFEFGCHFNFDTGTIQTNGTRNCCALGALSVGQRYNPVRIREVGPSQVICEELDVEWGAFVDGFDNHLREDAAHPDYRLGIACREACVAAGLFE